MPFLLFRGQILTLSSKTLINTKYHMFVTINISSNLLQTLSSFLTNNSKCYVTKKRKKSRHVGKIITWRHWKLTSLKYITIFKNKNLTENSNSNNNWKSLNISKFVTEKMRPAEYGLKELIFTLQFFSLSIACLARFSLIHKKDLW